MVTLFALFALGLGGVLVNGGSRMWETSINYASVNEIGGVLMTFVFNKMNASKRWITMNTGPDRFGDHIWPDRIITYAYKSEENEEGHLLHLRDATKLWAAAGLRDDVFKKIACWSEEEGVNSITT
ncbi:hypothetical protein Neosp_003544 [[Neocosmospora] mangrovei]